MSTKIYYNDEVYQKANNLSILDYARSSGFDLKREGKEYRASGMGGLLINADKNSFYWNTQQKGGGIVQFVMLTENKSRNEAIELLLGGNLERNVRQYIPPKQEPKKPFELPDTNDNYRRMFAYLTKTRGIDASIVQHFVKEKKLYESTKYHNCVFVSYGNDGKAVNAYLRGTMTDKPFKGSIESSNKNYPFCQVGSNNTLLVYEASIDLMSDMTFDKLKGLDGSIYAYHRIALGGVDGQPMDAYLKRHENINRVVFRLDNEHHGREATERLAGKLVMDGYSVKAFFPVLKDINNDLLDFKEQMKARAKDEEMEF